MVSFSILRLFGPIWRKCSAQVGPFSRKFPSAKVWAVPDQWAWPLDLAPKALGIFADGDLIDSASSASTYPSDFREEFEVKLLRPSQRLGLGYAASEAAVFHKPTHTLAITDALVNVPARPTPDYEFENLRGVGADAKTDNSPLGNTQTVTLRLASGPLKFDLSDLSIYAASCESHHHRRRPRHSADAYHG